MEDDAFERDFGERQNHPKEMPAEGQLPQRGSKLSKSRQGELAALQGILWAWGWELSWGAGREGWSEARSQILGATWSFSVD